MAWTIEYSRTARKFLEKTDSQTRDRVRDFLEVRLVAHGHPRELGKALKGAFGDFWSYRVGDLRIICDLMDGRMVVLVVAIGNRREVYKA